MNIKEYQSSVAEPVVEPFVVSIVMGWVCSPLLFVDKPEEYAADFVSLIEHAKTLKLFNRFTLPVDVPA